MAIPAHWSQDPLFPETFSNPKFAPHFTIARPPRNLIGKAGYYCFDLSCPITADTYTSVLASATVTLTAAKELLSGESVFALSRPPGHHAGTSVSGGYCYFNNVAIVARYLQREPGGLTHSKIAILDIDYHHGNGTQEIFYSDPSVVYVSLHAELDYPYFTGSREERGDGPGEGFNHNFPLPPGTGDYAYCGELRKGARVIDEFNPAYLIVRYEHDVISMMPITMTNASKPGSRHVRE
ncbi:Arginase/deacetylase [Thelephora ganbajun]|uniref:Arginase/deacetylase n=1 Tax=Thelephora ganbajun TaxID=370292 RepID=A0ACB6ZKC9_THEGA|nr:Arginase/deacetylase [Thelephora ganbajun]